MIALLLLSLAAWAAGAVEVVTEPAGAAIVVDGQPTDLLTPATVRDLAAGRHTVEVRRGCHAGRQVVDVLDGSTAQLRVELVEQGGMLQLQLSPAEATVELNGAPFPVVANVPMAVDCGKHQLRVTAPGHSQAVISVNVVAGRTTTLPVTLDPIGRGVLDIDVAPASASIWLDEELVGTGPMQLEVNAGPHAMRATRDGFIDQERQVVAIADGSVPVAFSLEPVPQVVGTGSEPAPQTGVTRERKRRPWIGLAVAGLGLGAVGIGTAEYFGAKPSYDAFLDRRASIEAGSWPMEVDDDPASWAYELYDEEVAPARQRMIILDAVGGVLLTTGLVLTFTL